MYAAIAKAPRLSSGDRSVSTRRFMQEINRFGITSVADAGGGSHYYPPKTTQ